jgi:NAD(P)-dependent dehydrogenase (short-subunit alcohol dehydrogenase family)
MQSLDGKVAVVTGGGSGIGRGIALTLARERMTVAVADLRGESARAVADEIAAQGGRALGVEVDVTSVDSLAVAAKEISARAGGVNLLCANAGVLARIAPLAEHTLEDWEYTLSVNVLGVVKTVQAFLPALRASAPDAHIVTTASLGGLISVERFPIGAYTASKYACVGYTEMLRGELEPEGIGVSVLCPGVVASSLSQTSAANRPSSYGEQHGPALPGSADASQRAAAIQAMPAEDVGPVVVRGVLENRLHILTHPQSRPLVERRFQALLDDYDFSAKAAEQAAKTAGQ